MRTFLKLLSIGTVFLLLSCHSEPSLQKYYVKHQNDQNFVVLDVPASLLLRGKKDMPAELQSAFDHIHKANVLAFPLNGNNEKEYKKQKQKVNHILQSGTYKLLFYLNYDQKNFQLRYLGHQNQINEVVLMASDDSKGFILARLLGNDMNPEVFAKILKASFSGEVHINIRQLDTLF